MIRISRLKKTFGQTTACDIPSFQVNDGDILGLVGNNGAGKTTLFRMLLDLLPADEGIISIDGINPAESETWKGHVGAYINEGFLIDFLTPDEYFAFLAKISGIKSAEAQKRLEMFERFAADELFGHHKLIRNLSAGNKQKVGIISALFRHPKTVILDEPFNFLDPTSQLVLKQLIVDYAALTGSTILISSHNLQHTIDISTRIALLEHGHIIHDLPNHEASAAEQLQTYFGSD